MGVAWILGPTGRVDRPFVPLFPRMRSSHPVPDHKIIGWELEGSSREVPTMCQSLLSAQNRKKKGLKKPLLSGSSQ